MVSVTLGHAPRPKWRLRRQHILPVIGVTFTLLLIMLPLAAMMTFSFREGTPWAPGDYSLLNYIRAYTDLDTYTIFFNTVLIAVTSTVISVAIAVGFAFLTERTDMPFRNLAWGLMLLPMAMPGLLFAVSWTMLLSPRIGMLNSMLREFLNLFGADMTTGPFNIYSLTGMIFLEGVRGVTTTFLIMVGAFRAMDPNLEEAARASGASNMTTFSRVFIPLLTPAIFAAGMYSFMTHLESLEIPIIIGLPARIYVFPSYIFFSTQRFMPPEYGLSAALGASFLLVSILMVYWYRRVAGRIGRYATITGRGYRPRVIRLGKWRYWFFSIFLLYFLFAIGAPTFALMWSSLLPIPMAPSWDLIDKLSLANYWDVLGEPKNLAATLNTVWIAIGTATLTMVLSLNVAWVIVRQRVRTSGILDALTFLPHAIPGVIIGISLIFLFTLPLVRELKLYGTLTSVVLGLTIAYIAFGSRTMQSALSQIHAEMEEAAMTCGAKWRVIMVCIIVPLLLPAFISGWIWVASHALRNFSIPVLLTGRDNHVLSVIMWHSWDDGYPGQTAAMGVLLIVALGILTIGGRALTARLSRQQET